MTADELRDELVAALCQVTDMDPTDVDEGEAAQVCNALLPVVRRYAARELRAMANVFTADSRHLAGGAPYAQAGQDLRDRADAIEAGE